MECQLGWSGGRVGPAVTRSLRWRSISAVIAMGEVLVWCVRVLLAIILIGSVSVLAALLLLVCDINSDLRRVFGGVAAGCFASLFVLVPAMFVVGAARRRALRNNVNRREPR